MSFKQYAYPLRIEPMMSRYWTVIGCCLHLISCVGIIYASLPWYVYTVVQAFIIVSFACFLRCCRRHLSLTWDAGGDWYIVIDGCPITRARLLGSSVVSRYFVWLHFRCERRFVPLILPFDSLSADDFRRLRVRLLVAAMEVSKLPIRH